MSQARQARQRLPFVVVWTDFKGIRHQRAWMGERDSDIRSKASTITDCRSVDLIQPISQKVYEQITAQHRKTNKYVRVRTR